MANVCSYDVTYTSQIYVTTSRKQLWHRDLKGALKTPSFFSCRNQIRVGSCFLAAGLRRVASGEAARDIRSQPKSRVFAAPPLPPPQKNDKGTLGMTQSRPIYPASYVGYTLLSLHYADQELFPCHSPSPNLQWLGTRLKLYALRKLPLSN